MTITGNCCFTVCSQRHVPQQQIENNWVYPLIYIFSSVGLSTTHTHRELPQTVVSYHKNTWIVSKVMQG